MNKTDISSRANKAARLCRELKLTQAQIAADLGASQPQVSRILSGQNLRRSRLFEEVCLYVERFAKGVTTEAVQNNPVLLAALAETWDGTAAHANALATVIRSLRALGGRS